MKTKYSIIVPVYNAEKYIKDCILSVINQSYDNWELILIDDSSSDQSAKICEEFQTLDRVVVKRLKNNSGVSHARNIGLQYATGQYVMFLDSDDWISIQTLEELNDVVENTNASILLFNFWKEFKHRRETLPCNMKPKSHTIITGEEARLIAMHPALNEKGYPEVFNGILGKIILREIILVNALSFAEELFLSEDVLFMIQLYQHCNQIYIYNENLYHYRMVKQSLSHSTTRNYFENDIIFFQKLERCIKQDKREQKAYYNRIAVSLYEREMENLLAISERKCYMARIRLKGYMRIEPYSSLFEHITWKELSWKQRFVLWCIKYRMYWWALCVTNTRLLIKNILRGGGNDDSYI